MLLPKMGQGSFEKVLFDAWNILGAREGIPVSPLGLEVVDEIFHAPFHKENVDLVDFRFSWIPNVIPKRIQKSVQRLTDYPPAFLWVVFMIDHDLLPAVILPTKLIIKNQRSKIRVQGFL